MEEFIDFDNEFKKLQKDIENKRRQSIKGLYKNKIKITFLYKVYENIRSKTNNFQSLNAFYPNDDINTAVNFFAGGDPIDLDVCNQITYIHRYNMLMLSDEQKSKYQNDINYIEKLSNQVLQQIYTRRYGSMNFKHYEFYKYERYEYYPPVYTLNNLIMMLCENINTIFDNLFDHQKEELLSTLLSVIVNKSKAIIAVIACNNLHCGFSILRGIIELYITFLCLKFTSLNSKIYTEFLDYKIYYNKNNEFSNEFERKFNEKSKDISIIDYLNYGWLDSIFEFDYMGIKKQYKFIDLLNLAEFVTKKDKVINDIVLSLRFYYYKCHIYTHGSIIKDHDYKELANLCIPLSDVILGVVREIIKKKQIKNEHGINMIKAMHDSIIDFKTKIKQIDSSL